RGCSVGLLTAAVRCWVVFPPTRAGGSGMDAGTRLTHRQAASADGKRVRGRGGGPIARSARGPRSVRGRARPEGDQPARGAGRLGGPRRRRARGGESTQG